MLMYLLRLHDSNDNMYIYIKKFPTDYNIEIGETTGMASFGVRPLF